MSGKSARRLRKSGKNFRFSKKTLAVCAGLCLSYAPVTAGGEFLVSVFPQFTKPFGEAHSMQYGMGAGLKATYRPWKFLNLFAQGEYLSMALPGVSPVTVLDADVGTGYHVDVSDRISLDFNINVGAYSAKSGKSVTGLSAGGSLVFSYKINPSIYIDVNASGKHYAANPSPLMMVNAGIGPGITFNVTEIFNNKTNIGIEVNELAPVFPVLYSWYENNSFGSVNITNNEDSSISDVTISFFQPQYMAHAKECATFKKIKRGETVNVDLLAFFNEQMLELTEKTDTSSYIIVNYSRLGKKLSQSFAMDVPVYGRNNMSWDDDRRAAVFVSSKDPAAMQFAKYTASIVRDNMRTDMPVNIQYAIGIFQALNQFGLNYVVDPSSAFEDNVGTSSIDFLQFPYQTLMYRGGDCDDLSILVCSLFEAVGIDTAFITVPGHIFMAFDSGITPEQAKLLYRNSSEYIVVDDQVWIPLEITLSDEGFYRACRYGAREWNNAEAQGAAALYKMHDSWEIYQPISVPGATAYFNIPESENILLAFQTGADEWKRGLLRNDPLRPVVQFVALEEENEEEELVIKGNPLSEKSLNDILTLGNSVAALSPSVLHEEEEKDERLAEGGDGDGDGDGNGSYDEFGANALIEDLFPLDFAIATATLQTDVSVKTSEENIGLEEITEETEAAMSDEVEEEEILAVTLPDEITKLPDFIIPHTEEVAEAEEEAPAPVEQEEEVAVDNENEFEFENTDDFLKELEAASEKSAKGKTKTIVIISTVTIAAALAAGLIIFGKKKREEESK